MNHLIKISVAIFIPLMIFVTSCSNLGYGKVEITKSHFSKTYCRYDSTLCAQLTINLQTIEKAKNKTIQSIINNKIKNTVFSQLKNYNPHNAQKSIQDTIANNFFNEYKSFLKGFPNYKIGWEISVCDSVIFSNKIFVTVKVSGLFFTGGAHPNSFSNYKTYSLNLVAQPTLQSLFKPNFKNNLLSTAETVFRKQKGLTPKADLNKAGYWFKDNKFSLNNNWGIVKNGILFFYNDYEIAPHSMGTTTLLIPFSKIENLLADKNLMR